ncbi:uncharacterized protein LOC123975116 [Micropterus dolomieu]|uniref:uncharacterized protein LOC123975116 n=1 Tax=Micropterus dolomieu TaxID=147949 RepID=UPI001E8E482A|nr:uncharacterized protein LOC123975116 [Micropterus dolomieu]
MKFSFVLFLLVGIPPLKGQQRIEEFEHILLRLTFPSFYNSYNKSCCKLYPGGCYKLLDSTGYTCDLLEGRVTKSENDGWIEFKISDVQFVDGGYYRCMVLGIQNPIYSDYYVEVSEVSLHHSQSQPSVATTVKAPNTSTTLPDSTGPVLAQDHVDSPRVSWSFGLPLAVIVSIAVMILITSVIGVVLCSVKAKPKQSNKYGETLCESLKQEAPEMSGIVYTTVDFRAHQKPTELYANLRMHETQAGGPNSTWSAEHDGMVEYSTLAIHQ